MIERGGQIKSNDLGAAGTGQSFCNGGALFNGWERYEKRGWLVLINAGTVTRN